MPEKLDLPKGLDLPCFVYGSLKPGELAFGQVERYVVPEPQEASVVGELRVRDGLPLLRSDPGSKVRGFVLTFARERQVDAYNTICEFEPAKHYQWDVTVTDGAIDVNVLVGRKPEKGSQDFDSDSWHARNDPVFGFGVDAVRQVVQSDAALPFESAPPDAVDWPRFFRLEMGYLLLWSIAERFTAFRFGPSLEPHQRVKRLGSDEAFKRALRSVERIDEVFDSRDPDDKHRLDRDRPESSIKYYYQVRSNLSHRGKGAWAEAEKVRRSLCEFFGIVEQMLGPHSNGPNRGGQ